MSWLLSICGEIDSSIMKKRWSRSERIQYKSKKEEGMKEGATSKRAQVERGCYFRAWKVSSDKRRQVVAMQQVGSVSGALARLFEKREQKPKHENTYNARLPHRGNTTREQ